MRPFAQVWSMRPRGLDSILFVTTLTENMAMGDKAPKDKTKQKKIDDKKKAPAAKPAAESKPTKK